MLYPLSYWGRAVRGRGAAPQPTGIYPELVRRTPDPRSEHVSVASLRRRQL